MFFFLLSILMSMQNFFQRHFCKLPKIPLLKFMNYKKYPELNCYFNFFQSYPLVFIVMRILSNMPRNKEKLSKKYFQKSN